MELFPRLKIHFFNIILFDIFNCISVPSRRMQREQMWGAVSPNQRGL